MAKSRPPESRDELPPPPTTESVLPRVVPAWRRCPICHAGYGGCGRCYSTAGTKRYYKCDRCGHTWTATVSAEAMTLEFREIEIDQRTK